MEKILFNSSFIIMCICGVAFSADAQAPSYKNFEWDILRAGYGNLTNTERLSGGLTLGTEVRYNISDFYSIGFGGDVIIAVSNINNDDADLEVLSNGSITFDRYFSNRSAKRPFVGISIGTSDSFQQYVRDGVDLDPFDEHSSFGFGARVGYEVSHLRILAQYQYTTSGDVLNGFSLSAALTLWGGYKNSN